MSTAIGVEAAIELALLSDPAETCLREAMHVTCEQVLDCCDRANEAAQLCPNSGAHQNLALPSGWGASVRQQPGCAEPNAPLAALPPP